MTYQKKSSFTVIGAGRSGAGVSKLLARHGNKVKLYDENTAEKLKYSDADELEKEGVELFLGNWSEELLNCDTLVKSPGVPPANEKVQLAVTAGIRVVSEIEAAFAYCPCPVIAVTGTNGKTTTTVLAGEILKNAGIDVRVCGNVGVAFSEVVDGLKTDSIAVVEVSSYQLNDIDSFKADVGVIMNITPDHLEWHGNFENYLHAKFRIAENMNDECLLVINYDDETLRDEAEKIEVPRAYFGTGNDVYRNSEIGAYADEGIMYFFDKEKEIHEQIMETRDINIRGRHNLYNSLAAAISARAFGIGKEVISATLKEFAGVEHRIEFVREIRGISFYNDSKATNTDSMSVALESFDGNIVLIMGGREKGNDYSAVDELIKKRVKAIVAVGETKDKIKGHFGNIVGVETADDMKDAVEKAYRAAVSGDTVLLSPACKSFDMFDSFEHRGEIFKKIVSELK